MQVLQIVRLVVVLWLLPALAGCMSIHEDLTVTSDTTAAGSLTMEIGPFASALLKSGEGGQFCTGAGTTLTENGDGYTCVAAFEGPFEAMRLGDASTPPVFTSAGPGLVRVAVRVRDAVEQLRSYVPAGETADDLYRGFSATLRIGGGEVVDTNMTLAGDRSSAEQTVTLLDLINGTVTLPDELYAVVQTGSPGGTEPPPEEAVPADPGNDPMPSEDLGTGEDSDGGGSGDE